MLFASCTLVLSPNSFSPQFVKRTIPIDPHLVGLARSSFSTSIARGARADDHEPNGFEIPEMTPDSLLELFEDRMATCSDPQWLTAGDHDPKTPTRARYLKTIMSNIWLLSAYLTSVDVDEFRTAEVEPGSRIDRGRNALMSLAKITATWMHEAFPTGTDDEELTECLRNLARNKFPNLRPINYSFMSSESKTIPSYEPLPSKYSANGLESQLVPWINLSMFAGAIEAIILSFFLYPLGLPVVIGESPYTETTISHVFQATFVGGAMVGSGGGLASFALMSTSDTLTVLSIIIMDVCSWFSFPVGVAVLHGMMESEGFCIVDAIEMNAWALGGLLLIILYCIGGNAASCRRRKNLAETESSMM
ncbi:hypothetical protein A0H81_13368 [Grifola frondosa]|uniref:Uncharacterized protein n=1 Tax=Grifola frondosa TaxID=5627 RepID=A0A1C7LR42_GRIFR|nr:hypothetical protein A0H81_13368 [Grifola frondosa]